MLYICVNRPKVMSDKSPHTIYQLFIDSCKKYSANEALNIQGKSYNYKAFFSIVSAIRRQIQGTKVDTRLIGIYTNEHVNTYASIWSVMSTGAAYVPINKKHPVDRAAGIIMDAGLGILLYAEESEALFDLKQKLEGKVVFVKTETNIEAEHDYNFAEIKGEDLTFVYFWKHR